MGFLLMQYEYQRASREVSIHQRAGIRLNNQVTRYTKRVERMQSLFDKAKTKLENNLNSQQNTYSNYITQAATTCSSMDASTANTNFLAQLGAIVIGGIPLSSYVTGVTFTQDSDGNISQQSILTALTTAAAAARSVLSTLMTELKEVETTKLEDQQDAQLSPISEKESDLQAEKDLEDTLCEMWKERKENAKSELADAIKGGMASYGLKG